jgi:hypothetical protein
MNMQFAGNLLENGKQETEKNGFFSKDWKERNNQRVLFLLMLADAIAYKPNGGKKVKPVPPPMILPDPGMVFEHRGTFPDEYEARNAYGTFLVRRQKTVSGLPAQWEMINPSGQFIAREWLRSVLIANLGCTYNNNNRPLRNR